MEFKVNKASAQEKNMDVGANIFVGNLDPEVDEKLLYDTFSAFGVILQVKSNMCYYFPDDFIESYTFRIVYHFVTIIFVSGTQNHARSGFGLQQRLRIHQLRLLRSVRHGHGSHEWAVPLQSVEIIQV